MIQYDPLLQKLKGLSSNKSTTYILISILIIVFYLFLFLRPKIREISLLLPQVSELKAKIAGLEDDWANIEAFEKKVLRLNKKIDYYEKKLPNEKEIPAILEYLSDAARKMNVRITEIQPLEQDKDAASLASLYYKVPILLKAECGYHQLGRFLNELENTDRFIKISDLKIVANPLRADIHDVQLIVVTYVMKY